MLLNCGVGEDSWESLGQQGDPTSPSQRRSVLSVHWKDWCWSWNSDTLATWCEELTHLERPWCWEGLRAGGEGDGRGWGSWMASSTQWTWVWVNSGNQWWSGRPGVEQSMGSQSQTQPSNWTELQMSQIHSSQIKEGGRCEGWEIPGTIPISSHEMLRTGSQTPHSTSQIPEQNQVLLLHPGFHKSFFKDPFSLESPSLL